MRYRNLGRTGYKVSEVGFGGWGIGGQMWKGSQDAQSLKALHRAIDEGVNFIDTALVYGNGHSERLIGKLIKQRSERLYVASKVPPKNFVWPARGEISEVFPTDHIIQSTEKSLRNLGVERLDLQQLHVWNPDWIEADEWYEALTELKESGKVAFFGISINDHAPESALEIVNAGKTDTVQVIFNVFDQSPRDELFQACDQQNVGIIVRVPFDEGALTGNVTPDTEFPARDWRNLYFKGDRKQQVHERVQRLQQFINGEVETLPELALRFCLSHKPVSTVIPGMRSERHVVQNTAASEAGPLSDDLLEKLLEHRWIRNFYPEN